MLIGQRAKHFGIALSIDLIISENGRWALDSVSKIIDDKIILRRLGRMIEQTTC